MTQKGKPTSDLKKYTIIYCLYKDETYQFNLGVSSGWAFSKYKTQVNPSAVVTTLGSSEETFGTNTYRKVTFTKGRMISPEEFNTVAENQTTLKQTVENDERFLLSSGEVKEELETIPWEDK